MTIAFLLPEIRFEFSFNLIGKMTIAFSLPEIRFEFSFNLIGKSTMAFSTDQSLRILKSWFTDGGLKQGFRCCFADRLNQNSGNPTTVTLSPGPFEIQDDTLAPAMQPTCIKRGLKSPPGIIIPPATKMALKWRLTCSLSSFSCCDKVYTNRVVLSNFSWRFLISFCSLSPSSIARLIARIRGNHSRSWSYSKTRKREMTTRQELLGNSPFLQRP